jgi:hypothetical protein
LNQTKSNRGPRFTLCWFRPQQPQRQGGSVQWQSSLFQSSAISFQQSHTSCKFDYLTIQSPPSLIHSNIRIGGITTTLFHGIPTTTSAQVHEITQTFNSAVFLVTILPLACCFTCACVGSLSAALSKHSCSVLHMLKERLHRSEGTWTSFLLKEQSLREGRIKRYLWGFRL